MPAKQTKSLDNEESERQKECCDLFVVKNVLFFFNFLLLLSGIAILCVGLWTVIDKHSYVSLLTTSIFEATTYLLVLTGAVTLFVVFGLGFWGAWRENKVCLMTYAILLVFIFILEAVCGILAYFYEAKIHDELVDSLNHRMVNSYRRDDVTITGSIDDLQLKFGCCGAISHKDWIGTVTQVPDSCCKSYSPGCATSHHPSNINYKGCVDSLADFLKSHLMKLGAVGLGLCCIQIFGIIFSCWLIRKIQQKTDEQKNHW